MNINPQFKKLFKVFIISFIVATLLLEWWAQKNVQNSRDGYWNMRFRKEGTAVEMYAHDIWLHGQRTLITPFDPAACDIKYFEKQLVFWSEVSCTAEDKNGQKWQYINRYSDAISPAFFIPFLIDVGPLREYRNISSIPVSNKESSI